MKKVTHVIWAMLMVLAMSSPAIAANAFLMPVPTAQFMDSNGVPLSGGMIYTCEAGSNCGPSTPFSYKHAYTDSTGAVALPDPIILDSAGRASIWLSGSYKVVLYDATGNLIWSVDNVSSSDLSLQYGVNVDSLGGLAAAVMSVGSTPSTLLILTEQDVTSTITIPANVTIQMVKGGSIHVSSGHTVTVSGNVSGVPTQWFYGPGTIVVNTYPQDKAWWGSAEQWVVNDQRVMSLVGEIKAWAGSTAPAGWLLCYGQAVSRTTYSSLYAIVGDTYGSGNGSSTFNVPDLRGRMLIGMDTMGGSAAGRVAAATSLGYAAGAEEHAHSVDLAHTHDITIPYRGYSYTDFVTGASDRLSTVDSVNTDYQSYSVMHSFNQDRITTSSAPIVVANTTELMPYAVDRNFSGASSWGNNNLSSYSSSGALTITASTIGQYCTLAVTSIPTTVGLSYQLKFDLSAVVGSWTIKSFDGTQTLGVVSSSGLQQAVNFVATTSGGIRIVANQATSSGVFDNFSLKLTSSSTSTTTTSSNGMNPYMSINYIIRY